MKSSKLDDANEKIENKGEIDSTPEDGSDGVAPENPLYSEPSAITN